MARRALFRWFGPAALVVALPLAALAQTASVGIGTAPPPDASAALDIVSFSKGARLPRLGRQVLAVKANATGTVVLVLPPGLATGIYAVRNGSRALRLVVE